MFICFTTCCVLAKSVYRCDIKFIDALSLLHSYVCQIRRAVPSHIFVRRGFTHALLDSTANSKCLPRALLPASARTMLAASSRRGWTCRCRGTWTGSFSWGWSPEGNREPIHYTALGIHSAALCLCRWRWMRIAAWSTCMQRWGSISSSCDDDTYLTAHKGPCTFLSSSPTSPPKKELKKKKKENKEKPIETITFAESSQANMRRQYKYLKPELPEMTLQAKYTTSKYCHGNDKAGK